MYKNINTLIARALLLGVISSFFVLSPVHEVVAASNGSDNFTYFPPVNPNPPTPPQMTPPRAPPPQVAEAPPVNNEYVLQRAARN